MDRTDLTTHLGIDGESTDTQIVDALLAAATDPSAAATRLAVARYGIDGARVVRGPNPIIGAAPTGVES